MSESINLIENVVTWQGEGGPNIGRRMILLRFKRCDRVENKNPCSWCDTIIKMRVSSEASYKIEDIQKSIYDNYAGLMISGGEPFYEPNFIYTMKLLRDINYPVANIETNGCNLIDFMHQCRVDSSKFRGDVKVIYSPKIFNMEDFKIEIERVEKCKDFSMFKNVYFKIVVDGNQFSNLFIENICNRFGLNDRIYLMPQGKNREELIKNAPVVFDMADEFKTNFSSREHLIYDFI